jgi:phospholipid N-methyltransferase
MVEDVALRPGTRLVEFGPGTGPITDEIARVLPAPSDYVGIERDAQFVRILQKRFPGLRFHCGLAQCVEEILAADPGGPVDAIISGLPFASFPERLQDSIIAAIATVLEPGGLFRTFQYVHAFLLPPAKRFRSRMDRTFGVHRCSRPVLRNVPPAFVLSWRLPAAAPRAGRPVADAAQETS